MDYAKQTYNSQYEKWMPWIEDVYLRWFTNDNKASYAAKENLDKSKVTGIEQVDTLQDGVNNLAASQVGQGGLLQPVGDAVSKEGVNRAERGGKEENGDYASSSIPGGDAAGKAAGGVADGGKAVAGGLSSGVQGAGNAVGGLFGGGQKEEEQQQK